jgi:uncharacterized membrane protein YdjX (TVP38/TMEM64 family)
MVLLLIIALVFREEIALFISFIKSDETHPVVLLFSFLILPIVGFPVTILLVMLGLRFDFLFGTLIMVLMMPIHLTLSFWVTHSIFGNKIKDIAGKKKYRIFDVPESRYFEFSFLFMAIPGLPYTAKNYLLPLFGIPFRHYFFIGWIVQGLAGIPFVILGEAASRWNVKLLLIFLPIFLVIYLFKQKIKAKYDRMVQYSAKENKPLKDP